MVRSPSNIQANNMVVSVYTIKEFTNAYFCLEFFMRTIIQLGECMFKVNAYARSVSMDVVLFSVSSTFEQVIIHVIKSVKLDYKSLRTVLKF